MKELIEHYNKRVDKVLRIRQIIFFVLIAILMFINIANVVVGKMDIILAISGFTISIIIGLLLTRVFKIFWHQKKKKVVYQLDRLGILLLIVYFIIELGRTWFLELWLSGPLLTSFGLIVLTGLLLGRFLGVFHKIHEVLKEEEII